MWSPVLNPPIRLVSRAGVRAPVSALLSRARRRAATRVRARHVERAGALARSGAAGDREARAQLIQLGERALQELADETRSELRGAPGAKAMLALDAGFHRCETREHMDDPDLPWQRRAQLVERLHEMNLVLDSYERFWRHLRPLLDGDTTHAQPLQILELAAGTGGLARWLARRAGEAGIPVQVTASDVNEQALSRGARQAAAEGLPVRFTPADALDLRSLSGDWDVILCAQALHHFPAGWLPVMYHQAVTRARRGVLFVDGCRSAITAAPFLGLCWLRYGDAGFCHDGWVSFRRFYVPEELGLLCALGPWADPADAQWIPPGHCAVRTATRAGTGGAGPAPETS